MNTQQLISELKVAKNSLTYKTAVDCLRNPGEWMTAGKNTGSGRYASPTCWHEHVVRALRQIGVAAETRNIAPRGGAAGWQVRVTI